MTISTELSDNRKQNFLHLDDDPRRRMVGRHVENEAAGETGACESDGGQSSVFLLGIDRTAPEDRQSETRANCRFRARHTFDFAHDVKFSSGHQSLPFKQYADPVATCGQDQRHAEGMFHCHFRIGRELPGRTNDVERFFEER